MISVAEAKDLLQRLGTINGRKRSKLIPLVESTGMYSAESIFAPNSVPPFDNSAMDGYALCYDELKPVMSLSATIRAGGPTVNPLQKDKVVRIFTGAPIPSGADTVVKQEDTSADAEHITIDTLKVNKGDFVRKAGAQCRMGEALFKADTKITVGVIALLSSFGIQNIKVWEKPKVGILLTGDEVVSGDQPLLPGQIYDANGPMLQTALSEMGIMVDIVAKVRDEKQAVQASLSQLIAKVDILLVSGGISVGDFDFVRPALEKLGVNALFYKVAQKPGKPLYVGHIDDKTIFALPGNPSSALNCFMVYVKPFIHQYCGGQNAWKPVRYLPLAHHYSKNSSLTFFLKCVLENDQITILDGQESFNLISFSIASGLLEIPAHITKAGEDDTFAYYPI